MKRKHFTALGITGALLGFAWYINKINGVKVYAAGEVSAVGSLGTSGE